MQEERGRAWWSLRRGRIGEVGEGCGLAKTRFKQEGRESNSGSLADVLFGVFLFFVFCFGGGGEVREGADIKNVGLRERAVAESLVNLHWRVSGDGLSIGHFRAGVRHGRLGGLCFWIFLRGLTSIGSGCLPLPGRILGVERRGCRLRVAGFGGSEVDVVVVG